MTTTRHHLVLLHVKKEQFLPHLVWARVFQRFNGQNLDDKHLEDYVNGFGDPFTVYWLGLSNMYKMGSNNRNLVLRVDIITRWKERLVFDYHDFHIHDNVSFSMDYQKRQLVKSKIIFY